LHDKIVLTMLCTNFKLIGLMVWALQDKSVSE